jgi:hypothetical protein
MNSRRFLRPPLAASEKTPMPLPLKEGRQDPPDTRLYVQSPVASFAYLLRNP